MAKIKISDVNKKHLRIIGYLVVSAVLAYIVGLISDKAEFQYLAQIINYILYAISNELSGEGYIRALKK